MSQLLKKILYPSPPLGMSRVNTYTSYRHCSDFVGLSAPASHNKTKRDSKFLIVYLVELCSLHVLILKLDNPEIYVMIASDPDLRELIS